MATLDDLLNAAHAIQQDHRVQSDRIIAILERGSGSGGPKPPDPTDPGTWTDRTAETLAKVSKAAGLAQTALSSFVGVFEKAISSLGGGMAKFVALANPATVLRFNIAVENAMSAVGKVLTPVMEKFTLIVQQLGNAIESLHPETKRAIAGFAAGGGLAGAVAALFAAGQLAVRAMGPLPAVLIALTSAVAGVLTTTASGQRVMGAFGQLMKAVGSFAEVAVRTLLPVAETVLVPAFVAAAQVMGDAAEAVRKLTNAARELVGLAAIDYDPNKKTAQAVRPGSFGDLRGYGNRAYASAYNTSSVDVAGAHFAEAKKQTALLERIARGATSGELKFFGTDLSFRHNWERVGRFVGGDTGAGIGRGAGGIADFGAKPFTTLFRMASALID